MHESGAYTSPKRCHGALPGRQFCAIGSRLYIFIRRLFSRPQSARNRRLFPLVAFAATRWRDDRRLRLSLSPMSALFDVSSLLTCLLLAICTCAYLRALTFRTGSAVPSLLDHARHGFGAWRRAAVLLAGPRQAARAWRGSRGAFARCDCARVSRGHPAPLARPAAQAPRPGSSPAWASGCRPGCRWAALPWPYTRCC